MSLRVLIVDDSSAARAFVRAALEQRGIVATREAKNGFEALQCLARESFDVMVFDINMPDINGLELISFVRGSSIHRDTPIVIISTEGAKRDQERALQLGANMFITKPFKADEVSDAVLKLCAPRSAGP